ncbi:hypothetical protein X737_29050 [Mesorhizobium sp. L48C026A00]|nr:hypothetical protein X737_29050 [Mesorhizobium sp. L48C026A00]
MITGHSNTVTIIGHEYVDARLRQGFLPDAFGVLSQAAAITSDSGRASGATADRDREEASNGHSAQSVTNTRRSAIGVTLPFVSSMGTSKQHQERN